MTPASRTAIITGANSGLGLACARALLADQAWHVVLAVRDPDRGRSAVELIGEPSRCSVTELDLASLLSVRRFVAEHGERALPPTHALICNAGIQEVTHASVTSDGFELTFGVNHLGHFALVDGLLSQLAIPARIIVVSSDTHDPAKAVGMPAPRYRSAEALAHPSGEDVMSGRQRYTTSKLCNLLFVYELDRRLGRGKEGVTVNAFNPGLMPGTGLARDYGPVQRLAWRFVLPAARLLPQVRGVNRSGRDLAALAGDSRYDGVTGKYFDGAKAIRSSEESYDTAKALDLWQTSERLIAEPASVGPSPPPPPGLRDRI